MSRTPRNNRSRIRKIIVVLKSTGTSGKFKLRVFKELKGWVILLLLDGNVIIACSSNSLLNSLTPRNKLNWYALELMHVKG